MVGKTLRYRLFHVGRMPEEMQQEIASEIVLFSVEGISVALRRSGRVPGVRVTGGVSLGVGSFAVTTNRVVASRGRAKVVDVPSTAAVDGPATLTLSDGGLTVDWDLDRVHPACAGRMRIEFREPIPETTLASFPCRQILFEVDPQKVVRLFGSLRTLPS